MANNKDNPGFDDENVNEGNNNDDNFGLPDLDFKPLDSQEESRSETNEESEGDRSEGDNQSYTYTPVEEPKSNAPIIIGIVIGLVLIVSAFLIYQYVYKPKAEKAKKELLAKQEAEKLRKAEEARLAKEKADEEERKRLEAEKAAAVPAPPPAGTIETLSERTGHYYIVIHSALDDDLLMDFAKKLSAEGITTHIIPPGGKKKFYKLAIGDFENVADAEASVETEKAKYGDGLWVIKY